jgi:alkylation response protein AidB-like acyl-CoA dehydrogenase
MRRLTFSDSEEHAAVRSAVKQFLEKSFSGDGRSESAGDMRSLWSQMAQLGILAAPFPGELNGLGGGPIMMALIQEELGRRCASVPFLETICLCAGIIDCLARNPLRQQLLTDILNGRTIWAAAIFEPQSGFDPSHPTTRAERRGNCYILNGDKPVVTAAPQADKLLITARTSGPAGSVSAFMLDPGVAGVEIKAFTTVDGRSASKICLKNVSLPAAALLGEEGTAGSALNTAIDCAVCAACAEALGLITTLNAMTLEYVRSRKQFGVPIGSFQAIQHRLVDMYIAQQQALSMSRYAAGLLAQHDPRAGAAVCAARVQVGDASRLIRHEAVQMHGGMGMADEMAVGRYFKRLLALEIQFGSTGFHLDRYIERTKPAHDASRPGMDIS